MYKYKAVEELKEYPYLLLGSIGRTTDIDLIDEILESQDITKFTQDRYQRGIDSILEKDDTVFKYIFDKHINIEDSYFSIKPIVDYTKYKGIIKYNYEILKLYDRGNSFYDYYKRVEKLGELRNLALLLYYNISKKSTINSLKLIDRYLTDNIINPRDKVTIKNNQIRLYELLSSLLSVNSNLYYHSDRNLIEFFSLLIIKTLTKSQIIKLLIKLDNYSLCSEYTMLFDYVIDTITPSQYLDVRKKFYDSDIINYINIVKNKKSHITFMIRGLHNLRGYYSEFLSYFKLLVEVGLLNDSNSTIIFKEISLYNEFVYKVDGYHKKDILEIYQIFLSQGLDINLLIKEYSKTHNEFKTLGGGNNYMWSYNNRKEYILNSIIETLIFLKRRLLLVKLKEKIQT